MAELKLLITARVEEIKTKLSSAVKEGGRDFLKDLKGTIAGAARGIGGIPGALGGVVGGIGGGPLALIAAGVGAAVGILHIINDQIKKTNELLKKSSPAFTSTQSFLERFKELAFKPIGDVLAKLQQPFVQQIAGQSSALLEEARPFIERGDVEGVLGVFKDAFPDIVNTFKAAQEKIAPVEGFVTGFKNVLEVNLSAWAKSVEGYGRGFAEGLGVLHEANKRAQEDAVNRSKEAQTAWSQTLESSKAEMGRNLRSAFDSWLKGVFGIGGGNPPLSPVPNMSTPRGPGGVYNGRQFYYDSSGSVVWT